MQNNPDIIKKAKQQLRKWRVCHVILLLFIFLVYALIIHFGGTASALVAFVVFLILFSIERRIVFGKFIMAVLTEKLDADTYLEIVRQAKFDPPASSYQLYGEYFYGNYQNVVSICKMKLADTKINKRFTYQYLAYLANVYFDIGDVENLRGVCEQFEIALASEKPRKQEKYRKFYKRIEFYRSYLKRDFDACIAILNNTARDTFTQHKNTFSKAKLALARGNTDEARGYFETLAKEVPQLNYGKIAAEELKIMSEPDSDTSSTLFVISEEITEVTLYTAKNYNKRRKFAIGILAAALVLLIAGTIIIFIAERKSEAYIEEIRTLVEEDYDGVTVIETFTLKNGIYVVDTMFICTTDTDIIVGCIYHYEGEEEQYYAKLANLPLELLSDDSFSIWPSFAMSITSDNYISSCFYKEKSDIPAEYCHLSTIEIDGQTVYYAVTKITPLSQITQITQ